MYTGSRGCGTLAYDAAYISWSLGTNGIPVWKLIICPVFPIDHEALNISAQGMNIIPRMRNGEHQKDADGDLIYDLFDVVGKSHYPFKADYYEEVKIAGVSRRFPTNTDLAKLKIGVSTHFLCHFNGWQKDNTLSRLAVNENGFECTARKHDTPHPDDFNATCSSMWYTEMTEKDVHAVDEETFLRDRPNLTYWCRPIEKKPEFGFGAFMYLPVRNFAVTTNESGDLSDELLELVTKLEKMGASTTVVDLSDV